MLFVYLSVCLSVCQHGLVMQSVSAPPCAMGREAGRHNQQNTGSHAAPSRGCHALSIADNLEAVSNHRASIAVGFTIQNKNHAYYWPFPILPIGQMVALSRRLVPNGDYSSHTASISSRETGRIGSHPRIKNPSIHRQLQQNGDQNGAPPV